MNYLCSRQGEAQRIDPKQKPLRDPVRAHGREAGAGLKQKGGEDAGRWIRRQMNGGEGSADRWPEEE